jgi:hypothetical protein
MEMEVCHLTARVINNILMVQVNKYTGKPDAILSVGDIPEYERLSEAYKYNLIDLFNVFHKRVGNTSQPVILPYIKHIYLHSNPNASTPELSISSERRSNCSSYSSFPKRAVSKPQSCYRCVRCALFNCV